MRPLATALLALAAFARAESPLDPLPAAEWTREAAAHLLRRAGFGGPAEEAEALHRLGLEGAVDSLLDFDGKPDPALPPLELTLFDRPERRQFAGKSPEEIQTILQGIQREDRLQFQRIRDWWMRTMILTAHPLRERMTLFWHGHFTSSYRDVRDSYEMYVQNTLLRRHALGSFRELLHDISRDPAMLEYLDNKSNHKGKPNENYAREVMELFTLGAGNYTEEDVKEAARAFTGWTSSREHRFVFRARDHDDGPKTFLGRRGDFDGSDVLDIILEQPAAARHVATRIFREFAHDEPSPAISDALGALFREAKYELKPLLRAILLSREFYSARSTGTRIKGPVEFIVGLYRTLRLPPPSQPVLPLLAGTLGQDLFDPPNVKGWDGGRDWITTSHLFNRYNIAGAVVGLPEDRLRALDRVRGAGRPGGGKGAERAGGAEGEGMREGMEEEMAPDARMPNEEEEAAVGPSRARERLQRAGAIYDVAAEVRRLGLATPEEIVDHYLRTLLAVPASAEMRDSLLEYLRKYGPPEPGRPGAAEALHGLLRLIVSTPEFQLT